MAIRQATRQSTEARSVPSLQIVPRLQAAADGDGASLESSGGIGLRAGLFALIAAMAIAAGAYMLIHRRHHAPARNPASSGAVQQPHWIRARPVPIYTGADTAVAETGARLMVAGGQVRGAVAAAPRQTTTAPRHTAAPSTHYLSASDLTSLVDSAGGYQPPAYLVSAYRVVAHRYDIPWRMLAAIEYIQGGYTDAIAGPSARAERTVAAQVSANGRPGVNANVLARAVTAAGKPSLALLSTARQLAADGAARSPAMALGTYMHDSSEPIQAVLTLAQETSPAAGSDAATPQAKVAAMLGEAKLLNGLPYVWGGGHTEPAWVVGSGYDCSGFVSEVLHSAGYLSSPQTTQTLPGSAGILKGRGRYVTIYDRTIATVKVWVKKKKVITVKKAVNPASIGVHVTRGRHANSMNSVSIKLPKWVGEWKTIRITKLVPSLDNSNNDEHVIIDIDGQWWESGGSSTDGGAAMVHPILNPSPGYLKSFNRILHPQGL